MPARAATRELTQHVWHGREGSDVARVRGSGASSSFLHEMSITWACELFAQSAEDESATEVEEHTDVHHGTPHDEAVAHAELERLLA